VAEVPARNRGGRQRIVLLEPHALVAIAEDLPAS